MDNIIFNFLNKVISSENYGLFCTIIIVLILIYGIYNKIKYRCLEDICLFVAMVESNKDLTGEAKFNLVKDYINNSLKITKVKFMNKIVDKLIQYAYDNSKSYALNYISRKTGIKIDEIELMLEKIKEAQE